MTVTKTMTAAALAGAILYGFAAPGAMAASPSVERTAAKVADAAPLSQNAAIEEDEPATCSKSRKRLWVESEGWIVRRVTICR